MYVYTCKCVCAYYVCIHNYIFIFICILSVTTSLIHTHPRNMILLMGLAGQLERFYGGICPEISESGKASDQLARAAGGVSAETNSFSPCSAQMISGLGPATH